MGCCAAKASAPAKATYALLERSPSDTAEQVPDLEEPSAEVDLPSSEVDSARSQRDSHTDDEQLKEHASAGFYEEFLKKGKLAWTHFKTSRFGVFLLERWLPLQDTSLDLLVTFGKQGWPLCSDDGLLGAKFCESAWERFLSETAHHETQPFLCETRGTLRFQCLGMSRQQAFHKPLRAKCRLSLQALWLLEQQREEWQHECARAPLPRAGASNGVKRIKRESLRRATLHAPPQESKP